MGLLKVHEVNPMQNVGASEAIDLNQHAFIWEVAKLSWAGYYVNLGFSLIFFHVMVLDPLNMSLFRRVGCSFLS